MDSAPNPLVGEGESDPSPTPTLFFKVTIIYTEMKVNFSSDLIYSVGGVNYLLSSKLMCNIFCL